MSEESPQSRLIGAGYSMLPWPNAYMSPKNSPFGGRVVTIEEAIAALDAQEQDEERAA